MIPQSQSEEQIVRYLLHELSADEREQLEKRLFRDPPFFEYVASVEDDLIMRYVRGSLNANLLDRFTEVYLGSEAKRKRVDYARALRQAVQDIDRTQTQAAHKSRRLPPLRFSLAAAAAVVLLAVLWPLLRHSASNPGHVPGVPEVAFSLDPGLVRGSGGVSIRVPQGTRVRFHLALANAATNVSYKAILETPERPGIWNGVATVEGAGVFIVVPADVLSPADYTLQLEANAGGKPENVAIYYFRVEK